MKILILEDEEIIARHLEGLVKQCPQPVEVLSVIPSVQEALHWLRTHPSPDLILMDIHLEDDLVFALFDSIDLTVPVIFTTAYDEYVIQAFKVNSIDYLLKPIQYETLAAAFDKYHTFERHFTRTLPANMAPLLAQLKVKEYKDRFMVTLGNKIQSIPTNDIAYFFLEEKMTFLVTDKGARLPINYSLDLLSQVLDPHEFFRVNRQYYIAHRAIQAAHHYSTGKLKLELQPSPKEMVFVSGDRLTPFKEWLGK
jgi:DNA-binding LytR/AlgR family response regulator